MTTFGIERVGPGGVEALEMANRLFGEVFGEEGYHGPPPGRDHLGRLLLDETFVALVALIDGEMVGALAGFMTWPCERNGAGRVWRPR